jgi:hypothetical protein
VEGFSYKETISVKKLGQLFRSRSSLCAVLQGMPGSLPWGVLLTFLNDFLSQQKGMTIASATWVCHATYCDSSSQPSCSTQEKKAIHLDAKAFIFGDMKVHHAWRLASRWVLCTGDDHLGAWRRGWSDWWWSHRTVAAQSEAGLHASVCGHLRCAGGRPHLVSH